MAALDCLVRVIKKSQMIFKNEYETFLTSRSPEHNGVSSGSRSGLNDEELERFQRIVTKMIKGLMMKGSRSWDHLAWRREIGEVISWQSSSTVRGGLVQVWLPPVPQLYRSLGKGN